MAPRPRADRDDADRGRRGGGRLRAVRRELQSGLDAASLSRNCKTRGDLLEWTVAEFYALLKSDTTLKKGRHVYLAALQTALGITLKSDSSCKTESKGKSGGDTTVTPPARSCHPLASARASGSPTRTCTTLCRARACRR